MSRQKGGEPSKSTVRPAYPPYPPKCMGAGCGVPVNCGGARGLCRKCIHKLQYAVRLGHTTYAEEEKAGRCLPAISRSEQAKRWMRWYKARR